MSFAYVSLGEVSTRHPLAMRRLARARVVHENTTWSSYRVDITHDPWANAIVERVNSHVESGFDGIFFDTVDAALFGDGLFPPGDSRRSLP